LVLLTFATSGPALAQQQQLIPLRVRLGDVAMQKTPFLVAYDEGIYKKNGLDVDQFISPGAAETVRRSGVTVPSQYVRDDSAPISIGGGNGVVYGRSRNARSQDRVILASTAYIVHWQIMARPEFARLEQLKGKRLGYSSPGAMTHFIALKVAQRMGWHPDHDISLLEDALAVDTLRSGAVDAFIAYEIPRVMAMAEGYKVLEDLSEWNMAIAGSGVNTSRAWLKDNRDTARRFIRSLVEAIALLKQDKSVGTRAMKKWYGINDSEHLSVMYDSDIAWIPKKPYPAVEGIQAAIDLYMNNELKNLTPADFIDDSFVRELDESGFIDSNYR
jgi:ABC-type nitrate/sulfonate/bicarbonate transport system substrate-binding protein